MSKSIGQVLKYDVVFEEAHEGGYFAHVPALPGCLSEGDTFEETKENVKEAIITYIESLSLDGEKPPTPTSIFMGTIEIPYSSIANA